jgi:HEAT repeat protein
MKKLSLFVVMSMLVPAVAGAQALPPVPTAPVPPPAPMVAPVPMPAPMPMPMPTPMPVMIPSLADSFVIDSQVREAAERARIAAQDARLFNDSFKYDYNFQTTIGPYNTGEGERGYYDRGLNALAAKNYEQAIMRFDQVVAMKGKLVDAALYWKAFGQFKSGKSSDSLATLSEINRNHKDSKYTSDAKALEAEVKRTQGQPARPETEDDEDLKLLAINGLQNSDPERTIPLLQGVLTSAGSLKLKHRALYVLALSSSPQARQILVNIAKGGNPDLQLKAIEYLGINRPRVAGQTSQTSAAELADIYNSTENVDVKRAILRAWGSAGDRASLLSIASTGSSVIDLRSEAVRQLGSAQGGPELWSMYQKESNKDLKLQIISALGNMGAYDKVIEVAKTEKDPEIQSRAIRSLGNMRMERSGQALVEIYPSLSAVDAKKSVISGLGNQNNAEGLVAIYRKESSFELKKSIIDRLSGMAKTNKVAQDFLIEILK